MSKPTVPTTQARRRLQAIALLAGGFIGPCGASLVVAMIPELATHFEVGTASAAATVTSYLLPLSLGMLVSGYWGERWGRNRTVMVAYGTFVVACLVAVVVPSFLTFQFARIVQGLANAFITPLLVATLADLTPRPRLGTALGVFGACQAAGQAFAPLIGGLAAAWHWQAAFVGLGIATLCLCVIGLPASAAGTARREAPWTLPPRIIWRIGLVALLGWAVLGGSNYLVSLRIEDHFGVSPAIRGLVLTGFGVVGILTARVLGRAVDRWGPYRAAVAGTVVGALVMVGVATAESLIVIGIIWAAAGAASQLVLVGVNSAGLRAQSRNDAGSVGIVQALRFLGAAISPTLLTPLYGVHPRAAFMLPALVAVAVVPLMMPRNPGAGS